MDIVRGMTALLRSEMFINLTMLMFSFAVFIREKVYLFLK